MVMVPTPEAVSCKVAAPIRAALSAHSAAPMESVWMDTPAPRVFTSARVTRPETNVVMTSAPESPSTATLCRMGGRGRGIGSPASRSWYREQPTDAIARQPNARTRLVTVTAYYGQSQSLGATYRDWESNSPGRTHAAPVFDDPVVQAARQGQGLGSEQASHRYEPDSDTHRLHGTGAAMARVEQRINARRQDDRDHQAGRLRLSPVLVIARDSGSDRIGQIRDPWSWRWQKLRAPHWPGRVDECRRSKHSHGGASREIAP